MQVHLLGIGNVGKLIAHGLAKSAPRPKITILFHRTNLAAEWKAYNESIEIVTAGNSDFSTGYEVETISTNDDILSCQKPDSIIKFLIVSTKTTKTVAAIQTIKHRLTKDTTLLLAQNGMGVIEELNRAIFPDPGSRPQYAGAVVMHGIHTKTTFGSYHAGTNSMTVGLIPDYSTNIISPPSICPERGSFLKLMEAAPCLNAQPVSPGELLAQQFEKLAINGSMSAISSILDCKYGDLFHSTSQSNNERNWRIAQCTIQEMSRVIIAILRESARYVNVRPNEARFSPAALERLVLRTALSVGESYSSMVEDVRAKRDTEIEYINGYILQKGREIGLNCPTNAKLVELVQRGRHGEDLGNFYLM